MPGSLQEHDLECTNVTASFPDQRAANDALNNNFNSVTVQDQPAQRLQEQGLDGVAQFKCQRNPPNGVKVSSLLQVAYHPLCLHVPYAQFLFSSAAAG